LVKEDVMADLQVEGVAAQGSGLAPATSTVEATGAVEAELPITPELDLLIRRAAWLGRDDRGKPTASFTSLFVAFLASPDALSAWVQDKLAWIGPVLGDVVRQWKTHGTWRRADDLDERCVEQARERTDLSDVEIVLTTSAARVIDAARDLARRVGSAELAPRHVFAAYLYAPTGHDDSVKAWKLDREAWATRFRCYVTAAEPCEAHAWRALHERVFTRMPSVGVHTVLQWAAAVAREGGAQELDVHAVLSGIVLDGIAYRTDPVTSAVLVRCLGGVAAVEAVIERPTADGSSLTMPPYKDELWPIIDRALVFATATRKVPSTGLAQPTMRLHVRHLLAALLTDRRPLAAFAILRRAGRTQDGVLAQVRRSIQELADRNDDAARWEQLFEEYRDEVVAWYDNDEADGEDRLNIDPDVRALAAVLASNQVRPPLSVGLFGDWGSGKSFFMTRLRRRIERLEAAARARPEAESWFCGQRGSVVQIEFNAWHYMDADLWSSLAVRVFDELSDRFKDVFAKQCANKLGSLQEHEAALKANALALDASAKQLDDRLAELRGQRAARDVTAREYGEGIVRGIARDVARDPKVEAATKELRLQRDAAANELAEVKRDLSGLAGTITRVWRARSSGARLATLGLLLGAPAIVGVVAWLVAGAAWAGVGVLGSALPALGVLRGPVRETAARFRGLVDAALDRVEQIEREARAHKTAEEQRVEADRERLGAQVAELEREHIELSKRKAQVQVELDQLQHVDKRTLRDFILQRAAADDYRKNLGVVSAVHKDFQELASWLGVSKDEPNVERIILYIDDLDRCSPERVVDVLQAIHVILSLRLFVVVVAVDSRWLLDSLSAYYRRQFPKDAADLARPQQYLEKIFQIPFTLLPMSSTGYAKLAGSMLERHVDVAPAHQGQVQEAEAASHDEVATSAPSAFPPRATAPARPVSSRIELTPRGLRLEPDEAAHLGTLSGFVASPRATKRLVNVYRIVRSTLDDQALDHLVRGGYRATQLCLALVIGNPRLGAELFGQILSRALGSRDDVVRWCGERAKLTDTDVRDRASLREVSKRGGELADWPAVKQAVRQVARFSFETGRVLGYHLAEDPTTSADTPEDFA
jgi:hypothetical protein